MNHSDRRITSYHNSLSSLLYINILNIIVNNLLFYCCQRANNRPIEHRKVADSLNWQGVRLILAINEKLAILRGLAKGVLAINTKIENSYTTASVQFNLNATT